MGRVNQKSAPAGESCNTGALGKKEIRAAAFADLAKSGIDQKVAAKVGIKIYTAAECAKELKELPVYGAGYTIPYFDESHKRTGFYRFRYLDLAPDAKGKVLRYAQPTASRVEVYFDPLTKWKDIKADSSKAVLFTEGEKKQLCVAIHVGIPCIGLGGVYSFGERKRGSSLVPALKNFNWENRPVYIAYDSDAVDNPLVLKAETQLAREILALGARPHIVRVPSILSHGKTAIDDYTMARSAQETIKLIKSAPEWQLSEQVHLFNAEIVYIEEPSSIAIYPTDKVPVVKLISVHEAQYERFANRHTIILDGKKSLKVPAFGEWFTGPVRPSVRGLDFAPGKPAIVDGLLNTWAGWPFVAKRGNVQPWTDLLDFMFDGEPASHRFFEQWAAYPIQNPGAKLKQAVIFTSRHAQVGKSLTAEMLGRIYGRAYADVDATSFASSFNSQWAIGHALVSVSEATEDHGRKMADTLKHYVTAPTIVVNTKKIAAYAIPNRMNFIFSSNHRNAMTFSEHETRYFVHQVKGEPQPKSFYEPFRKCLGSLPQDDTLTPAIMHHLLHEVDCSKFEPFGHALRTEAFKDMAGATRSDIAAWCRDLVADPDTVLVGDTPRARQGSLFSTRDLVEQYQLSRGETSLRERGMVNALKDAGLEYVYNGSTIPTPHETVKKQRLWPVRNRETLARMTEKGLAEVYRTPKKPVPAENKANLRRVK